MIARQTKRVPIPNDASSESSRRDHSNAVLFMADTIPTVEISTRSGQNLALRPYLIRPLRLARQRRLRQPRWHRPQNLNSDTVVIITTSTPLRQLRCFTAVLGTTPALDIGRIYTTNDPRCEVGSRLELLLRLQSMLIQLTLIAWIIVNFLKACEEAEKESAWTPRCGVRPLPPEGSSSEAMLVVHVVDLTRYDGVMLASWNYVFLDGCRGGT